MEYLIAHRETCDIVKRGPVTRMQYRDLVGMIAKEEKVVTLCTCGGVRIPVTK